MTLRTREEEAQKFSVVHPLLRFTAIVTGLLLLVSALTAWIDPWVGNAWLALGASAAIAVIPALLIVDRLLPKDDPTRGRGIPTDTLSVLWLGGATLIYGPLAFWLHDPLLALASKTGERGPLVIAAEYLVHRAPESAEAFAPMVASPMEAEPVNARAVDAGLDAGPPVAINAGGGLDAGQDGGTDAGASSEPLTDEMSPAEIFREYASSVVTIQTGRAGALEGGGTGFVIDAHGIIATNHHVIQDARHVRVKLLDGSYADSVELLVSDVAHDLALLQIRTQQRLEAVRLGDSEAVEVGERATVIGNPLGLEHTLSDGLVSARRRIDERNLIQMTAPVSPGNSGGPVFNGRGEVIGVTTAIYAMGVGQNLNLAVPINQLRALVRDDIQTVAGSVKQARAWGRGDASKHGIGASSGALRGARTECHDAPSP